MKFTVVDIGACVGVFSEKYWDKPNTFIYAFEPLPVNYKHLANRCKNHDNIRLYNWAVSDFDGKSKFYKKYKKVNGKKEYDYLTCSGCSLKKDKGNVDPHNYDTIKVVKLSTFVKDNKIEKIDVLKIDTEGSEYDIIEDLLDSGLYKVTDLILYEDHIGKVKSIADKREIILNRIKELGIENKFKLED